MKILFFGPIAEIARFGEQVVQLPKDVAKMSELRQYVLRTWPWLADELEGPGVRVAVNGALAFGDPVISDTDEIAFLPIVSGG